MVAVLVTAAVVLAGGGFIAGSRRFRSCLDVGNVVIAVVL